MSLLVQIDCEQLAHALHIARGRLEDQVPRTRLIGAHVDAIPIQRLAVVEAGSGRWLRMLDVAASE